MINNNGCTNFGIEYSRYIVSWKRSGGKIYRGGLFEKWLAAEGLTEEEIKDILNLAENGKCELEIKASKFIEENNNENLEERAMSVFGGRFDECTGNHINNIKTMFAKVKNEYES